MDNEFQKRWERIQQALAVELSGEVKPRVSSGRTLFGIKSEGETKMDEFAKQIEEEYTAKRRAEKEASTNKHWRSPFLGHQETENVRTNWQRPLICLCAFSRYSQSLRRIPAKAKQPVKNNQTNNSAFAYRAACPATTTRSPLTAQRRKPPRSEACSAIISALPSFSAHKGAKAQ